MRMRRAILKNDHWKSLKSNEYYEFLLWLQKQMPIHGSYVYYVKGQRRLVMRRRSC